MKHARTHFSVTDLPVGEPTGLDECPLRAAVAVLGGKWTLIVLYALSRRPRGFLELQRLAPGVSHKVLSFTLRKLEAEGLVRRTVLEGKPLRVEYALTAAGETVQPVLDTLCAWGNDWLALGEKSPID